MILDCAKFEKRNLRVFSKDNIFREYLVEFYPIPNDLLVFRLIGGNQILKEVFINPDDLFNDSGAMPKIVRKF